MDKSGGEGERQREGKDTGSERLSWGWEPIHPNMHSDILVITADEHE